MQTHLLQPQCRAAEPPHTTQTPNRRAGCIASDVTPAALARLPLLAPSHTFRLPTHHTLQILTHHSEAHPRGRLQCRATSGLHRPLGDHCWRLHTHSDIRRLVCSTHHCPSTLQHPPELRHRSCEYFCKIQRTAEQNSMAVSNNRLLSSGRVRHWKA